MNKLAQIPALGDKVRDKLTGFEGIVIARTEYINGCIHACVKAQTLKDGKPLDGEWIDWSQLEVLERRVMVPFMARLINEPDDQRTSPGETPRGVGTMR